MIGEVTMIHMITMITTEDGRGSIEDTRRKCDRMDNKDNMGKNTRIFCMRFPYGFTVNQWIKSSFVCICKNKRYHNIVHLLNVIISTV